MRGLYSLRIACARVFERRAYVFLAGALALPTFLLAVWLPNLRLIAQVGSDPRTSVRAALELALGLLGGIGTNFSLLAAAYTVMIALLFGVTAAMIVFSIRQRQAAGRGIAVSSGAMASGVLGIGCAACGSLILSVLLPALGATGALAALPLQGEEFGILSVVLLVAALVLVSKNIAQADTCALARSDLRAQG